MKRFAWTAWLMAGCVAGSGSGSGSGSGKADTGWISDAAFEGEAVVKGSVSHEAEGEWAALDRDAGLQEQLIDSQVKFLKNGMFQKGWHVNQLVDRVSVTSARREGAVVTLDYEAVVDMLHERSGAVPTLDQIDEKRFTMQVPVDPVGAYYRHDDKCAQGEDDSSVSERNYYYYFKPDKEGCDMPLFSASVELVKVFADRTVYPEYDQLGGAMRAALLPNEGDYDPLSRFDVHKDMLERKLRLAGTASEDGTYRRYTWKDAGVEMVIDLYDPTKIAFTEQFRAALREYQLVFYNGHSSYGTQQFLTDRRAFSDRYQIVFMHSCRSYEYYARQVFRAKATAADPRGFARADVVATGESSYPSDSPRTLEPLMRALMKGMTAVAQKQPKAAPSWQSIVRQMNSLTDGILYGAAGVRENAWQP